MADQNLKILIDSVFSAKGFEQANKSIGEVDNGTKKLKSSNDLLSSSFSSLGGILATVGFATLAKEAIQMADTYKLMSARLSLVTDSTKEFVTAQSKIFAMSQETRSSLEATTSLYTKLAMSTESMGKSQDQILAVTKSVNEAMKISGATTQEATATILQLGQALQSGTLQGDEYRSLRENAPRLAKAIADGMGVEIGALKELSSQGKLTAEVVFAAIEKSGSKLDSEFTKIPPTVSDSITKISNSFLKLVGDVDNSVNGSGGIAEIMDDMSKSIDKNSTKIANYTGHLGKEISTRFAAVGSIVGVVSSGVLYSTTSLIEMTVNGWYNSFNWLIHGAEWVTNKLRGMAGKESITLGKLDLIDFGSSTYKQQMKDYATEMRAIADSYENFNINSNKLNIDEESRKNNSKNHNNALTAAEIKAAKKAAEEEAKIQRGYLEGYADLQAKAALDDYNTKLGYEESYRDIQAQNAIEEFNQDQANLNAWADIEAQAAIKKFEDETKFWDDLFVNINKAMDDQFFNAMSGKFTSFGDWLKDFWGSITQSMTRGLSKSLADTIMGTGNNSEGGIANWFKSYGGFSGVMGGASTPSYLLGATTDAAGLTTTTGGTVLNSAGQIIQSGSDSMTVLDGLNSASTANSLYSAYTGGISGSIASGSASLSGMAYNMGWTTGGDFFAGGASGAYGGGGSVSGGAFGAGQSAGAFANGAAQIGAAYMAAYYTGRGIDKLTGSDTYSGDVYGQIKDFGKMSATDKAILGTLSMIPGGSILAGGLIGKRKTSSIGSGIEFNSTGSADNVDARSYIDMKSTKKSWFKSSTSYWTEYQALSDKYTESIASTFRSYDYLLTQMGESAKVAISAGKYAGTSFENAITRSFISVFTSNGMSEYNTSQLYTIWSDYASSINKTMIEAFSSSISGYIDTTRSFTEWKLGSGTAEQLKFTADYLAKDFNALSDSMGVSGLTVENYLQKYDEALKASFSPETITTWKNLGNALMSATDANTKYTESLKNVQATILPQDMNLSKGLDATQIYQTITTQNDTLKYSFSEMIQVLRNILYNQQFNGLNVGIPA